MVAHRSLHNNHPGRSVAVRRFSCELVSNWPTTYFLAQLTHYLIGPFSQRDHAATEASALTRRPNPSIPPEHPTPKTIQEQQCRPSSTPSNSVTSTSPTESLWPPSPACAAPPTTSPLPSWSTTTPSAPPPASSSPKARPSILSASVTPTSLASGP